jgi:hypothetical protein
MQTTVNQGQLTHTATPCKKKGRKKKDSEAILVSMAIFVRNMILVKRRGLMRALQGGKQKASEALWILGMEGLGALSPGTC